MSPTRKAIALALEGAEKDRMHFREIAEATGLPESTVKPQLSKMFHAGQINRPGEGFYSAISRNHRNPATFNGDRQVAPVAPVAKVAADARLQVNHSNPSTDPFDWTGSPKARLDEPLSSHWTTAAAVEKVRAEFAADGGEVDREV
jgi:hypothetical protein